MWGGCAWINLDHDAPPVRECLEPAATILDAWKVESLRTEKWYACRLPVNWKLAIEAFVEMYHVVQTHPQLVIPTRFGRRDDEAFDAAAFIDADIEYLRAMSEGMDGMCHADDVRIAEGPARCGAARPTRREAMATWNRTLNDAVVRWHRDAGHDVPDLNALDAHGLNLTFFHGFPHYFVLPMYSSASSYRFRPLGPEETLMEIWSLGRFPEGHEPAKPAPPEVWECDDPRWPPIPAQDFSNLPRQQQGLHAKGFEYMRLSSGLEGHISNFERTIDGFLAGLSHEQLLPALRIGQRVPLRPADPRPGILSMHTGTRHADVVEGVRAAIAAYTHALDDGRTDDVVATFCPDGVIEIPGMGTHAGHDALRDGLRRVDAAAATAPPRGEHPRHRLERRRGHGDQRRGLPAAGRRRLGDPGRRPLPRHPPPRRPRLALPPPPGGVRDVMRRTEADGPPTAAVRHEEEMA